MLTKANNIIIIKLIEFSGLLADFKECSFVIGLESYKVVLRQSGRKTTDYVRQTYVMSSNIHCATRYVYQKQDFM